MPRATYDSVLLMNKHFAKNASQKTIFLPDTTWITNEKDTKPYILEQSDNIKLLRSQYIATSIIKYGPYFDIC